ncbi:MAG TPA: flagellar export chaperone FliS [Solirubrobacteraceae bacterium]|nr:flagellar export chaperone FliS [Solirubrobacteraceae bacterium]
MSDLAVSPAAAYRRGEVLAATPGQLVVLLYDGARRFLRQAASAMRDREIERAHGALRRAERIIAHLDGTLDYEQGELSQRLHSIYSFCLVHLSAARIDLDADKLDEVSELLGELREAFSQAAAEVERA